jgi:pimeloyl-ACP methyl ester carboxylesterase
VPPNIQQYRELFVNVLAEGATGEYAIRLRIWGEGETILVVFAGSPGQIEDLFPATAYFDPKRYTLLFLDVPGYGSSSRPNSNEGWIPTIKRLMEMIRAAVRQITSRPVIIVSHSWACLLATGWAAYHVDEVDGLVLLAPVATESTEHELLPPFSRMLKSIESKNPENDNMRDGYRFKDKRFGEMLVSGIVKVFLKSATRKSLEAAFAPEKPDMNFVGRTANALESISRQRALYFDGWLAANGGLNDLTNRYKDIKCPVVIVQASDDHCVDNEQHSKPLQASLRSSTQVAVTIAESADGKGTGHLFPVTQPRQIALAVKELELVMTNMSNPKPAKSKLHLNREPNQALQKSELERPTISAAWLKKNREGSINFFATPQRAFESSGSYPVQRTGGEWKFGNFDLSIGVGESDDFLGKPKREASFRMGWSPKSAFRRSPLQL